LVTKPEDIYFYLKDEEYGWMSNFWTSSFYVGQKYYPTVEHYYQSKKTTDKYVERWIREAPKPYLAMKAGRMLRPKDGFKEDWEIVKLKIMKDGLWFKFSSNPVLKKKLLDTGDAVLHEKSPTDLFWGYLGADMLGKLLMELRDILRN
jgi:ribA/ribD-fused uncharacterized protein